MNWLDPIEVYQVLENYPKLKSSISSELPPSSYFLAWPIVFIWRKYLLPKIDEIEFITTLRFAYIGVLLLICIILCILGVLLIFIAE